MARHTAGMILRDITRSFAGGALATRMARLNARHPWSHNDHFHRWIVAKGIGLPPASSMRHSIFGPLVLKASKLSQIGCRSPTGG